MAEYAKKNDDTSMDPDEYSKFGMEAMKYVEQHFSGWSKKITLPVIESTR